MDIDRLSWAGQLQATHSFLVTPDIGTAKQIREFPPPSVMLSLQQYTLFLGEGTSGRANGRCTRSPHKDGRRCLGVHSGPELLLDLQPRRERCLEPITLRANV